jgi:DNA-binding winged helix-turn-helix (wHTH) protein
MLYSMDFPMSAELQTSQPAMLRFDTFELDLRSYELRKNGIRIRLQIKPAKLLAMLALQKGELVTRDEIEKALWKDEFVEFEHGINTAISKIRVALEDDREHPRVIETLPKQGYRFLADVEMIYRNGLKTPVEVHPPEPVPPSTDTTTPIKVEEDKPQEFVLPVSKPVARGFFLIIEFGYLAMYLAALVKMNALQELLGKGGLLDSTLIMIMCAIAVRIYLISAVGWGHPDAGRKFHQLFPALLVLDAVWAVSPLLVDTLNRGIALAGVAGLAYLPFAQRTLVRTLYPRF